MNCLDKLNETKGLIEELHSIVDPCCPDLIQDLNELHQKIISCIEKQIIEKANQGIEKKRKVNPPP